MATLFIFAGLPGTGKTTLAQRLAQITGAAYLRIDTVEQALRDLCGIHVQGEGYRLSYRVAADNLSLGLNVVADSCNPIELTRREWQQVAEDTGAAFVNIEVVCSDKHEHRRRVEERRSNAQEQHLPTWQEVDQREYHPWSVDRIVIDTAGRSVAQSMDELLAALGANVELPRTVASARQP